MTEQKKFPVLYGKTSSGKVKVWEIYVTTSNNSSTIIINHSQLNGKVTQDTREITKGKNIGKANETNHYQQAILEAQSKWNKKKSAGYTESVNTDSVNTDIPPRPMLAQPFEKYSHKLQFPIFVQPKIDGVRAVFLKNKLYSRTGKEFLHFDNIKNELKNISYVLDGELFTDKLPFKDLAGLVKKQKLNQIDIQQQNLVYYIVYDIIDTKLPYTERLVLLKNLFTTHNFKAIKLILTEQCETESQVKSFHDRYVRDKHEGLILRNKNGLYRTDYRSVDLQKFKEWKDAEFKIISFTEGTGREKGLIIFKCITENGQQFDVRPEGSYEERAKLFKQGDKLIGKMLTVKFKEYTPTGNVREPIGLTIRDYE